jgi:hypothetical protein
MASIALADGDEADGAAVAGPVGQAPIHPSRDRVAARSWWMDLDGSGLSGSAAAEFMFDLRLFSLIAHINSFSTGSGDVLLSS